MLRPENVPDSEFGGEGEDGLVRVILTNITDGTYNIWKTEWDNVVKMEPTEDLSMQKQVPNVVDWLFNGPALQDSGETMELDLTHNADEKTIPMTPTPSSSDIDPSSSPLSMTLQFLYAATFPYVGRDFLSHLVREIGQCTQTQTVLVQQLMTLEEYKELAESQQESPPFRLLTGNGDHNLQSKCENEPSPSPTFCNRPFLKDNDLTRSSIFSSDQVLLNRASYSTLSCDNM
ncbi:hypothetical protein DFQ28_001076 [Apophysomyces sp. BC1034]|nr:hypothetical protein DFQ28_001076 [Apophysomyces sp. BC1034]